MARATYDYETGKITRNFKFVRIGEPCKLTPTSEFVGDATCNNCKYNCGQFTLSYKYWGRSLVDETCCMCAHPHAKDFKGSGCFVADYNERLFYNAMCAY